ncbi:transporter [Kluyvera genomosp. 2]|uniref:transporter n=1 Tax=Kluyvera genomosp. 2 TaxID=2774054 RepID=UPI002FD846B4
MLLVNLLLRVIFLAAAVVVAVLCLHVDVNIFKNDLSEDSLTEIVQECILFGIVVIHLFRARKARIARQRHILIAGFFMAMLIRELDAVFDLIHHGSWLWFALAVSLVTIAYTFRRPQRVLAQLVEYTTTPSYGLMISGLLAILIFSRLFGMSMLWHSILQDGYVRVVKNMVEEGCELFGYMLCLGASVNLFPATHRSE